MNFSSVLYGPYSLPSLSSEEECTKPRSVSNEVHKIELTVGTLITNTTTSLMAVDTSAFLPTGRVWREVNHRFGQSA